MNISIIKVILKMLRPLPFTPLLQINRCIFYIELPACDVKMIVMISNGITVIMMYDSINFRVSDICSPLWITIFKWLFNSYWFFQCKYLNPPLLSLIFRSFLLVYVLCIYIPVHTLYIMAIFTLFPPLLIHKIMLYHPYSSTRFVFWDW